MSAIKYRRKPSPDIEAMQVTESAEQAEAIRSWLGTWGWFPNTSAMRPGCVVVRTSLSAHELAPPGYYVVRHPDGRVQVIASDDFADRYERAPENVPA